MELIINADDFGFSKGVNYGIIDSHRHGIVNSATLMVNTPGTEHAVELAKSYPNLRVGIHLVLTFGQPVHDHVPTLINEKGLFKLDKNFKSSIDINPEEVLAEWDAQIKKFRSFGIHPSHIDSHHHVHGWPVLEEVVKQLSLTYNLPVRNAFKRQVDGIPLLTEQFNDNFYGEKADVEFFENLLKEMKDNEMGSLEVMCHPAYIDTYLRMHSSYCDMRLKEVDVLTDGALKALLLEK
ncbi:chitin disaccharide deacetylase [Metabacillus indicus]|uniref:chitin disaccharide deacetylase n=1 Tax=Metabacillus indicus TaxID=246786 RepID=UPI0024934AA3|nr:chitin disaccharide deacetylase [Metabacillus indicus]